MHHYIKAGAVEALHAALAAATAAAAAIVAAEREEKEAVEKRIKARAKPKTEEVLEAERRRDDDRDVMQARAAGALAVMAIDPQARRRIFDLDPTLGAFLLPVHDHFDDPKPRISRRAAAEKARLEKEEKEKAARLEKEKERAAAAAAAEVAAATAAAIAQGGEAAEAAKAKAEEAAAELEAAAAKKAAEAEQAAIAAELAELQADMAAQKEAAAKEAKAAEKTARAAAAAKSGGNAFSGYHPIMDTVETWRAARAIVLSETVGTLLVRDAPGRIKFIRAGGISLLMRTLSRATDNRVIIALTSILAAFAEVRPVGRLIHHSHPRVRV